MELDDGPVIGDAFGAMLRAAYASVVSGTGPPVFATMERDDGLLTPHDPAQYFTGPAEWNAFELEACAQGTGRVLDVGCGAGRHALFLQEKGFSVTAIDVSEGACEVSMARGVRDVRRLGLAELPNLPDRFDTILMQGANLGLLGAGSPVLSALAAVAAPGAKILGGLGFTESSDPLQQAYYTRNRAAGRLPGTLRIRTRFANLADPWVGLTFCTAGELAGLVDGSPWVVGIVGGTEDSYLAELALARSD